LTLLTFGCPTDNALFMQFFASQTLTAQISYKKWKVQERNTSFDLKWTIVSFSHRKINADLKHKYNKNVLESY